MNILPEQNELILNWQKEEVSYENRQIAFWKIPCQNDERR